MLLILIRPFLSSLSHPLTNTIFSCTLIIASLFIILKNLSNLQKLPGEKFFLLFILGVIISTFLSQKLLVSIQALINFLAYIFVFLAVYSLRLDKRKFLLIGTIVTATIVSIYALYWLSIGSKHLLLYMQEHNIQYQHALEVLSRKRAFMPFVLPNALAGYLIMLLPLTLGYLAKSIEESKKYSIKNITLFLAVLVIATALLSTKSIGAFLSLFLAFVFFVLSARIFTKKIFLFSLIFLLLVGAMLFLRSYNGLYFTTPQFSILKRLSYWQDTSHIIAQHPLQGTGLGNFPLLQSLYAHNSYLQIWAETGILGITGFLGFLYAALRHIRLKRLHEEKFYAGCIIAFLGFLIHNFIDFSFFLPEVSLSWWIILAALL